MPAHNANLFYRNSKMSRDESYYTGIRLILQRLFSYRHFEERL